MDSATKRLQQKAMAEYNKSLNKIPAIVRHIDVNRHIANLWKAGGVGREASADTSIVLPIYTKLTLGITDRLGVEVPFFMEQMEERFELVFCDTSIDEILGVSYRYEAPHTGVFGVVLTVFFMPHDTATCTIVREEVGTVEMKQYRAKIVCP